MPFELYVDAIKIAIKPVSMLISERFFRPETGNDNFA